MYRKVLIVSLSLLFPFSLFSQLLTKKEFIKAVQAADISFYYEQDNERAVILYQSLADAYPENYNLAAKLGMCNLNIDGKKSDALKYLLFASKNVVKNDQEYTEYGEKAPLDTYLYLAIAYHQNDSLQKAITLFTDAKKRLTGTDIFSIDFIDNQIRDCKFAMEMQKRPQTIRKSLFTPWLSDFPGALNPVLSENDSVFVFTQRKNGKNRIFCSYKSDEWKLPVDITEQLGGIDRYYSNSITGDGKTLIIYLDDGDDGNLYYSHRNGASWTRIRSLGRAINTVYWESHGFITPDGKTLYFASNRPDGEGELDIWVSERETDGSWKRPVNCGSNINTPFNENTPCFDPGNGTLLFSSSGHTSIGGYDIFRSVYKNRTWSRPVGLPFPINSTTDDEFLVFNNNGAGFLTSLFDDKQGNRNIFALRPETPGDKEIIASGVITLQDGMPVDPEKASIVLTDSKTGIPLKNILVQDPASFRINIKPGDFRILISHIGYKTDTIDLKVKTDSLTTFKPLTDTGMFNFEVRPGDYLLYVRHKGYRTDTISLILPSVSAGNYIQINTSLIPEKVSSGDFLYIRNILFDFDSHKLNDIAIGSLEKLKSILENYPELKIEVAGYTDSKGSASHNRMLAEKRISSVIRYLTDSGISTSRFARKAVGSSDFAALNTNADGTDNPEGRKYNRRVTFGILDPKTGVTIRQETYTPEHLRHPASLRYSIVLLKSAETLGPDNFNGLEMSPALFISPVRKDSLTYFIIGEFFDKEDALKYMRYAKGKGFSDAYIISQFDLKKQSDTSADESLVQKPTPSGKVYTIQLRAARQPVNMNQFKAIDGVREIYSKDRYYRYVYGEYSSVSKAKADMISLREEGFIDAFIRDLGSITDK